MKTILYAWEIGDGLGHIKNLVACHKSEYLGRYKAVFACPPELTYAYKYLQDERLEIVSSPVLTGIDLTPFLNGAEFRAKTFADVLSAMGFADKVSFGWRMQQWLRVMREVKPDLIICESAPSVIIAAKASKNRIPVIQVGTPYAMPPTHLEKLPAFPNVDGRPRTNVFSDERIAKNINHVAFENSPLLKTLSQYIEPDCSVPFCYDGMDMWRLSRPSDAWKPLGHLRHYEESTFTGQAIFAYLDSQHPTIESIKFALSTLDIPSRVFVKGQNKVTRIGNMELLADGFDLESELKKCDRIMHHGSMGLAHAGLDAGLPQFLFPFHSENAQNCRRLITHYESACAIDYEFNSYFQKFMSQDIRRMKKIAKEVSRQLQSERSRFSPVDVVCTYASCYLECPPMKLKGSYK